MANLDQILFLLALDTLFTLMSLQHKHYLFRSNLLTLPSRTSLTDQTPTGLLLLRQPLSHQLGISGLIFLIPEHTGQLGRLSCPLALKSQRRNEPLNLGSLAHRLALLVGEGARNDVFAHVVLLFQIEELADLVGALGPKAAGHAVVREAGNGVVAHLNNGQVEHGNVMGDDAASDGLAFALAGPTLAVALVALVHEEADAVVAEDALTHGEALLVVAARDAEDVAGELLAEHGAVDFLGHAALVQVLEALFVVDFDDLLEAGGGHCDVDLCGEGSEWTSGASQ
jgi:hypothetical protein